MIDPIKQAIELAKQAIKKQEGTVPDLVGWYVCKHERHTVDISVGVELSPIVCFSILVRVDLVTGESELV